MWPSGLGDPAYRRLRARDLRNEGNANTKRDRNDLERLEPIVADDLPLAVLGAELLVSGNVERDLVPRQVSRKLFVAGLAILLLSTRVPGDLLLLRRVGNPFGRIDDIRRVAEVEDELLWVGKIPLRSLAEGPLECEVSFSDRLSKLGLLLFKLPVLLLDEGCVGGNDPVTLSNQCVTIQDRGILRHERRIEIAKQLVAGLDVARIGTCR